MYVYIYVYVYRYRADVRALLRTTDSWHHQDVIIEPGGSHHFQIHLLMNVYTIQSALSHSLSVISHLATVEKLEKG